MSDPEYLGYIVSTAWEWIKTAALWCFGGWLAFVVGRALIAILTDIKDGIESSKNQSIEVQILSQLKQINWR